MSVAEALAICVAQFLAMLACVEIGFRVGRRRVADATSRDAQRVIETATLALLGLLLGFAFAGAMARFNERRDLVAQEAAAISTAYHRLDVAPELYRTELRRLFHKYLEARLQSYDEPETAHFLQPEMRRALQLQRQIWAKAIEANRADTTGDTALLLLPALNGMTNVTMTRAAMLRVQTPFLILALLLIVALFTSFRAGYGMAISGRRDALHSMHYAAAVCLTIYVILDLDNPGRGLIRQGAAEEILDRLQREI
jgi:hypothetical protein